MNTVGLLDGAAITCTNNYASDVNPPSCCTEDPTNVGKCGDADGPPGLFGECEHVCSGELCWQASNHDIIPNLMDSAYSVQSRSRSRERPSYEAKRSPLSLVFSQAKSTESVYLDETPKLRRGMAFMEFEDGDCEPDHYLKTHVVRWNAPDCGLGDKKLDSNSNERGTGRSVLHWRVRKNRVLKQNPFSRFSKKVFMPSSIARAEPQKTEMEAVNGANAFPYKHAEELAMEHLPSGDLFHQFGFVNSTSRALNPVGRHV